MDVVEIQRNESLRQVIIETLLKNSKYVNKTVDQIISDADEYYRYVKGCNTMKFNTWTWLSSWVNKYEESQKDGKARDFLNWVNQQPMTAN